MRLNLDYIAGFIDGEGCIHIAPRKGPVLIVTNTRLDVLEAMRAFFDGVGRIYTREVAPGRTRACYSWRTWNRQCEQVLRRLAPHLITKAGEAELALRYFDLMVPHGAPQGGYRKGKGIDPAIWAERAELARQCKELKRQCA